MQAALGENGHVLEELYAGLQEYGECGYCGTLPADKPEDKSEDKKACKNCGELIEIGRKLLKTNKIFFTTDKLSHFNEMIRISEKDDKEFGYLTEYIPGNPLMSLPYTAPLKNNNDLCTFGDIAENAEGDKKLAMFKADIDNLGLIFTSSWGEGAENKISFSRYAQLSRHLHYFFSGFIAGFISDNPDHPEYNENIYTVFSGGDDLCIIGAWDTIMRFAADFRKNFSAFTNNNPSVTLSGGIAMFSPSLPVRSAAAMAEEALEKAKDRKDEKKTVKNGISVFGVTLSWEEYEESLEDAKKIVQYMDNKQVSSAVVYKMIDFANRAQMVRKGSLRNMVWMSNYRYTLARNIKPEHKDALKFFHKFSVSPEVMEKSRIAVSYALYINRKGKEE
jgi:CRISPR-associated protein Csm1